jgi:PBP superfamily domain
MPPVAQSRSNDVVMTTTGICRNPLCSKAAAAEIIEWYPGPGEYCPGCGEALHPQDGQPSALSSQASHAPENRMRDVLTPLKKASFGRSRLFLGALAVVLVTAIGYAFLSPRAMGRPAPVIQVCRSSITDRLAADLVRTFAARTGTPASRFAFVSEGPCDVRFSVGIARTGRDVVAHDGIVVVVNPRNQVTELSLAQIQGILTGVVTDWATLGGAQGSIVAMVPADGSDETNLLSEMLLHDGKLGGAVHRSRSSAAIVRAVAAPSGRDRIGFVTFSAAVPAKVVKIAWIPTPSTLTIADHRYPFSLSVAVGPESTGRDPLAADLLTYAHSDAAQALVVRDGFVGKAGF